MKSKFLFFGILALLLTMTFRTVYAVSGLESGIYIKASDIGKSKVDSIYIGYPDSQGVFSVIYMYEMEENQREKAEMKAIALW